jgi:hypothetical protein
MLYSPECVEGEFCELRVDGVLRSSDAAYLATEALHTPLYPPRSTKPLPRPANRLQYRHS